MFKLRPQVKRDVVRGMVDSKSVSVKLEEGSSSSIYGKYHYTSNDFKGQDYVKNENIISGEFIVPLMNSNNESKGWVSWQDLAYPTTDPKWSVQESITISLGTNHNAQTYTGSSLSVATGGYYDLGTTYTFYVSDDNGNNAVVSINKIDNVVRNLVIESIENVYHYTSIGFKGQDYVKNENIISGEFIVPLLDSNNESRGWVSWQSLAYPTTDPKWSVQESITISLGTNHNAQTYTGSSLSVATGGYYDLGTTYTFYVSDDNGNNAVVSINKIDNVVRNVIFERVKR